MLARRQVLAIMAAAAACALFSGCAAVKAKRINLFPATTSVWSGWIGAPDPRIGIEDKIESVEGVWLDGDTLWVEWTGSATKYLRYKPRPSKLYWEELPDEFFAGSFWAEFPLEAWTRDEGPGDQGRGMVAVERWSIREGAIPPRRVANARELYVYDHYLADDGRILNSRAPGQRSLEEAFEAGETFAVAGRSVRYPQHYTRGETAYEDWRRLAMVYVNAPGAEDVFDIRLSPRGQAGAFSGLSLSRLGTQAAGWGLLLPAGLLDCLVNVPLGTLAANLAWH